MENSLRAHQLVTNYRYDTTMAQDLIQDLKILNTYTTITLFSFKFGNTLQKTVQNFLKS